jgi:type VI protein secretion system component Hcp
MATIDGFLMPDGIKGESTDSKHSGAIELDAFHWGCYQGSTLGSATAGAGAAKARAVDLHFRARPSVATPLLFSYCSGGKPIPKVMLYIRKAGGNQIDYLTITLENVLVTSHRLALGFAVEESTDPPHYRIEAGNEGADDWVIWEYCSLAYGKYTLQYNAQQKDGTQGAATTKYWDFTLNSGG